ncbi:MAG: hypothetical protein A3H98_11115 [Bacteroidetes bacterium RIFCSPLOWO2_02_FULL_36_8]|nr:MAG: hypothetical protein A3H98_11115 [Bacteroidetes bacterium RIFCSPLOWO2_02_FULL_36_8]
MALEWMSELHTDQLAIVDKRIYEGIISEEELLDKNRTRSRISDFKLSFKEIFIAENRHIFEAIRLMNLNKLKLIAVLDEQNLFSGLITREELLKAFATITNSNENGAVMVLQAAANNYSLTEIARIVEENGSKILSVFVSPVPNQPQQIFITLKISTNELTSIVSSFERYRYLVYITFTETLNTENQRQRYEALMKYLEM